MNRELLAHVAILGILRENRPLSWAHRRCAAAGCLAPTRRTRAAAIFKRDTTHFGRKLSDAATATTRKQVIWEAPNLSSARPRILIEVKNLLDGTPC